MDVGAGLLRPALLHTNAGAGLPSDGRQPVPLIVAGRAARSILSLLM
jgi:hypothetical protein